ncbi:UPF0175 family protein [Candidatus Woesearchaeota archaeon]|nr:UPF0175 family protein [Candidatus Woesearchaeota archaeon]
MENVITARIPKSLDKDLTNVAKTEYLDKSTIIRKFLFTALNEWKKEQSIRLYKDGKFSGEQAAKFANLSMWEFFDLLKERKIPINYDTEEFEKDLKNIKWKKR